MKRLLSLFVLFLYVLPVLAMGVVHHIDIEQGLSNGFFTTMVIDKHGAVWCGSEMGLNRIMPDGCKAFLTYNSELKANEIVDLYP